MKIFQTQGADGLWHDVQDAQQYNKAYPAARRILDTDCPRFKYYEKLTGSFQKAMLIINTCDERNCNIDTPFYEPQNPTTTPKSDMLSKEKVIEILNTEKDYHHDQGHYVAQIAIQECITKIKEI